MSSRNNWGKIYTPHEETLYVSQGTPFDGLAESIVTAFNRGPKDGIDVTFMGDVSLTIAYKACLQAQALIVSQHPGTEISWKFSRRQVASRKVEGRVDVADFFTMVVGDVSNG